MDKSPLACTNAPPDIARANSSHCRVIVDAREEVLCQFVCLGVDGPIPCIRTLTARIPTNTHTVSNVPALFDSFVQKHALIFHRRSHLPLPLPLPQPVPLHEHCTYAASATSAMVRGGSEEEIGQDVNDSDSDENHSANLIQLVFVCHVKAWKVLSLAYWLVPGGAGLW
jgi:hypothetical protein